MPNTNSSKSCHDIAFLRGYLQRKLPEVFSKGHYNISETLAILGCVRLTLFWNKNIFWNILEELVRPHVKESNYSVCGIMAHVDNIEGCGTLTFVEISFPCFNLRVLIQQERKAVRKVEYAETVLPSYSVSEFSKSLSFFSGNFIIFFSF